MNLGVYFQGNICIENVFLNQRDFLTRLNYDCIEKFYVGEFYVGEGYRKSVEVKYYIYQAGYSCENYTTPRTLEMLNASEIPENELGFTHPVSLPVHFSP